MLYDQGQLAVVYCYAYLVTKDEMYADVVHDILTYVSRDLSHPVSVCIELLYLVFVYEKYEYLYAIES